MASQSSQAVAKGKSDVRDKVWSDLRQVAFPDSRFHYDFSSFIPDFEGSEEAVAALVKSPMFTGARVVFIAPDNCLECLRLATLQAGKSILMTTYGIRRGFWLLDPTSVPVNKWSYASTLDGMEKMGKHISLREMRESDLVVDLMVTGTGAINRRGIRFGKGHGYFDLEWALLSSLRIAGADTITVCVVHDCQVLDEAFVPELFDTVCDVIVTPTEMINVSQAQKPTCGILWPKLQPGMLEDIPPLRELRDMQAGAPQETLRL